MNVTASHQRRVHLALTIFWGITVIPTVVWWRESILWVALLNVWANVATHWSAFQGARAEVAAKEIAVNADKAEVNAKDVKVNGG